MVRNKIKIEKFDTHFPYSLEEALNSLRINVSFLGEDIKKIMVVSALPNEGKSFVTLNLWRQIASTGVDCAWVDCDLRNSIVVDKYAMHTINNEPIVGLSHYLSRKDDLDNYIYASEYGNSVLIPNNNNTINPSLLLEGNRFEEMLNTLSNKYRYVFLDTPPLQIVSDGERIGNLCDGAIIVVAADQTSKKLVHDTINKLERSGCKVLGIVLNKVDTKSRKYYGNNKYYYGNEYYYGGSNKK